jgi:hypothetical protein
MYEDDSDCHCPRNEIHGAEVIDVIIASRRLVSWDNDSPTIIIHDYDIGNTKMCDSKQQTNTLSCDGYHLFTAVLPVVVHFTGCWKFVTSWNNILTGN